MNHTSMAMLSIAAAWLAAASSPAPACADNSSPPPATQPGNPLAGLPSKAEGEHIEKIKALGDNSWVILGQAEVDPTWGVARGRSWGAKMACAPDLGGAFFCGTGVHGFVTPDGHFMDDLWVYDANAHRWICLYPGANTKTLKLKLDEHGFEVNERGEHIPVSYLSHTYNNVTYNTDLRLYHVMWTQSPWWGNALPQRWQWLDQTDPGVAKRSYGAVGPVIASPRHPLFWDVAAGKWQRRFAEGPGPGGRFEGVAEYIPSLKKTLYTHQGTTWFYDYAANAWTAGAKVPGAVAGYDSNGCFDAKRQRVYLAKGKGFAYFDVRAGAWHEVQARGQPDDLGATNNAQMYFDTASGVVLWHRSHGPLFTYDPDANAWTDMGDTCPPVPWKRHNVKYMCWHGFYSPDLNVHFFYLAGDSGLNDATVLAYRYRNVNVMPDGKDPTHEAERGASGGSGGSRFVAARARMKAP